MAVEIEAKMKVSDFTLVRQKLTELGAVGRGIVLETNIFFDTDDRSLLASDQGLRLRQKKHLGNGEEKYVITFKGPRQHGKLKNREEIELPVGNSRDTVSLFDKLGFHRVLSFEKRRETWILDQCMVELDELPCLGCYVEIEGASEEIILGVRDKLGLSDRPIIKEGYIALLTSYLQEQGDRRSVIAFAQAK